jgi:hypothetical protein
MVPSEQDSTFVPPGTMRLLSLWEPSKNSSFYRSYESDTTIGVVRPQPSPFSIPIAIGREGYREFLEVPLFENGFFKSLDAVFMVMNGYQLIGQSHYG